jgi:DNA modification methylase
VRIGTYETHPAADIFPLIEDEARRELELDIEANGLIEPIWLTADGLVLDGRNRLASCLNVHVAPRFRTYEGDDPVAFVVSLNLNRRHLNESQRAMVAARIATLPKGANQHAQIWASSQGEAARAVSVGRSSVQSARAVLEHAAPEVVAAVDAGRLAVSDAAKLSRQDVDTQREAMRFVESGGAKNAQQAMRRVEDDRRAATPSPERLDCRIIHGDAVEAVLSLDVAPHCVVMDPPYGIETHNTRRGGHDYADGEDYALALLDEVCAALASKLDPSAHVYVFSGYSYVHAFKEVLARHFDVQDNPLVWVKDNHTMCDFSKWYPSKHEYVLFAKMRGSQRKLAACLPDVLSHPRSRDTTHSAEKPPGLLQVLIEQSTVRGELVIDPFCGSGSTGVASLSCERSFVGIEAEERWVSIARGRVA